jgi:hypothetical protein
MPLPDCFGTDGDGLSVFQILRIIFIVPFSSYGFIGGFIRLVLLIGINIIYFLFLWGFLAEGEDENTSSILGGGD